MPELALLVLVIAAAIGFGVVNGFNDAANSVAASIGSRAISPRNAIILAAFCEFAGAATGLKVAETIGKGILSPEIMLSLPKIDAYLILIAALAELFEVCHLNACEVIKWREIYEHLESATDRGEDVANVLEGIVLKNA